MTRLIKTKWLVILKARKLFIYRAIIPTIFIDDDAWTLCVTRASVRQDPPWNPKRNFFFEISKINKKFILNTNNKFDNLMNEKEVEDFIKDCDDSSD